MKNSLILFISGLLLVGSAYSKTINICSKDQSNSEFIKLIERNGVLEIKHCDFGKMDNTCKIIMGAGRDVRVVSLSEDQFREMLETGKSLVISSSLIGGSSAGLGYLALAVLAPVDAGPAVGLLIVTALAESYATYKATGNLIDEKNATTSAIAVVQRALNEAQERECYYHDGNITDLASALYKTTAKINGGNR
mgnify:FL=1